MGRVGCGSFEADDPFVIFVYIHFCSLLSVCLLSVVFLQPGVLGRKSLNKHANTD